MKKLKQSRISSFFTRDPADEVIEVEQQKQESIVNLIEESNAEISANKTTRNPSFNAFHVPHYKIISKGPYCVDGFAAWTVPGVAFYFLTHFHSDHYFGLKKSFDGGKIICTNVTAALLKHKLKIKPHLIVALEYDSPFVLDDGKCVVSLYDANHCPGSCVIVFDFWKINFKVLHTGDFRYNRTMLSGLLTKERFDHVYFDNTYLNAKYSFPTQTHAIQMAIEEITNRRNAASRALIVVGTYLIGKERVLNQLAAHFNFRIWADRTKRSIFDKINDAALDACLHDDPHMAQLHAVSMATLSFKAAQAYFDQFYPHFGEFFIVKPTGWSFNTKKPFSTTHLYSAKYGTVKGIVHSIEIPYSEHSSFEELRQFVQDVKCNAFTATSSPPLRGKTISRKQLLKSFSAT